MQRLPAPRGLHDSVSDARHNTDEPIGFRDAILERRLPVEFDRTDAIDIVGTGGDGKNTFNISTATCFVVAGTGRRVIKHGNYGASSVSGASSVLEYHGVRFTNRRINPAQVA